MDTAVATAPNNVISLVPAKPGIAARWGQLSTRSQMMALAGVAALIAILALMFVGARDSDYRPLFPSLSEKDGGQIIDRLAQMAVPYKFAEGGSVILVPSSRVHELRMKLAAQGLPSTGSSGGAAGYELLDKNSFGQTQGQERMKMQRAIEGELTNTIQALEGVKSARVHLALPQMNGFFREQQKPSASVVLTLNPGRTLDRNQIAGIVKVVSSSVPELAAKAVSVVDSTGALLSAANEDDGSGLDSRQLQFRREVEASHLKRVMALLEPVVGRDNVRATVSAEIDFSTVEQRSDTFRPNQGADAKATVREQRSDESNQPGGGVAAGTPGAVSNQPPTPAAAPINGSAQAMQAAQGNGGTGNNGSMRREAATKYEVDQTVTYTKNAVGNVKRLSAAVVVNHRTSTDAKGKTTTTPLSDKEVEQLTALVQQGIGFSSERGDVVKVVNAPFRAEPTPAAEDTPLWKQQWLIDLLKTFAAPAALALVALVIISKLIKPAVDAAMAPPPPPEPGSQIAEVVADDLPPPKPETPAVLQAPTNSNKLESARNLAKSNPAAVAHIVRNMVNGANG